MSWTDSYWDTVNEFYWVPTYLGLKSIPRKKWTIDAGTVSIPIEVTNPSGPLYRRIINSKDFPEFIRRQEETFNHLFNLTLSLLPGKLISTTFQPFFEKTIETDYLLANSEHYRGFPWIDNANVSTPDSFLISDESILAVEIKFNAKTSLDQLAKYVALIASEMIYGRQQQHYSLLYIYPNNAVENFHKEISLLPSDIDENCLNLLIENCKNKKACDFLMHESNAVKQVLENLEVSCITWQNMHERLAELIEELSDSVGDQTLARLLGGLNTEIERHPLSGV